jgi:hypothetical protein
MMPMHYFWVAGNKFSLYETDYVMSCFCIEISTGLIYSMDKDHESVTRVASNFGKVLGTENLGAKFLS